jgi:hypothetical protein
MTIERDIIGINVEVQFADGTITKGHLSPTGTHINRTQPDAERIRWHLEAMREGVEAAFKPRKELKPYGSRQG